jgi:hypothetical protein
MMSLVHFGHTQIELTFIPIAGWSGAAVAVSPRYDLERIGREADCHHCRHDRHDTGLGL